MEILFNNPIANMSGPAFIAFFIVAAVVSAVIFSVLKRSFDWTSKMPIPNIPHDIDPFEIAYLRGGENELARSVVFSLTRKGFLEIANETKMSFISQVKSQPNWSQLSQIERNVLPFFQVTRETKELFASDGLTSIVAPFATVYESRAKASHFLLSVDMKRKTHFAAIAIASSLALMVVYRMFLAYKIGSSNVIFLIVFLVLSIVAYGFMKQTGRLSKLGKKYLESLQTAFDRLRYTPTLEINQMQPQTTFSAIDPTLLAVGLFGTSVLAGSAYGSYEQAFHRSAATSGCGSACGSSCSSGDSGSSWSDGGSSSSDSGSSCSSGDGGSGCGGGGCGGGCS